jgi:tetratricopeptide (TPR) repeat protein
LRRPGPLALAAALLLGAAVAGCWALSGHDLRAGEEALARREPGQALARLRRSLRLWPWRPRAYLLAARAARGAGEVGDAEGYLEEAERRGADAEEVTLEGYLLGLRKGDLPPGVEEMLWHRVETEHPRAGEVLEALGQAHLYAYRVGDALRCTERWVERDPDSSHALYFRGLVREALQGLDLAGADYRRAVELDPDNRPARLRLAEWCLARHHPGEAAEHFERLLGAEPGRWDCTLGLARARLDQADYARAGPLLDELLARDDLPGSARARALLDRARLASALRRHDEAERFYRRALEHDPASAEACRGLTRCLARAGRPEEAERFRKKADEIEADLERLHKVLERLGKAPEDVAARYEAATICLRNGQKREARRWLLSILRLRPDHQPSREALARCD